MQPGGMWIESELQNLLRDERARCDQHKQMYQTLKEEHGKLQDELTVKVQQLKEIQERKDLDQTSYTLQIKKLEEILGEKQNEVAVLTEKVSSLSSKEHIDNAFKESAKVYDEQISRLQDELDRNREQYNELHYNYTVIKCQMDFADNERTTLQELTNARHMTEVNELKAKIEALENEQKVPVKDYSTELKATEKEIVQVNSRLKTVLSECEELRAQNEKTTLELDAVYQTSSKQHSEHVANIRALESEKSTLAMQKDVLEAELTAQQNQRHALSLELQDTKQEALSLRSRLEEQKNKYEIDTANFKLEIQQGKIDLEAENERHKNEAERLKSEIRTMLSEVESVKIIFLEKEQALLKHIQDIKQQSQQRYKELEYEKEQVEVDLKELVVTRKEELENFQQSLVEANENVKVLKQEKMTVEKSLMELKSQIEENSRKHEKEVFKNIENKNEEFHKEIELLKSQLNQLIIRRDDFVASQKAVYDGCMDGKTAEIQGKFYQEELQLRLTLEQQKYQFQQRIDTLESQLKEHKNTWLNEKKEMQSKLKQYARLITKLREKLETQKSRVEELEAENEIISKNVPFEEHSQIKKQLADLQQKHETFQQVMATGLPFGADASLDFLYTLEAKSVKKLPLSPLSRNSQLLPELATGSYLKSHGDVEVTGETHIKKSKSQSQKRRPQRQKLKVQRVDYSSSSDIENF